MKRILFSLIAFLSASFISAQTPSIRLGVLKGISCAPCAYLIENRAKLSVQNMAFKIYDSVQGELPALLKDELDMGFISPKDAVKVFNKGAGAIVAVGVVQSGNLYFLTNDEMYLNLENLKGKNVVCAENDYGDAAVLEHVLLRRNISVGTDEDSVKLDFSLPTANIANGLILGNIQYAFVSEPFATVALLHSSKTYRIESIQKLYSDNEQGSSIPVMLLVARADFAKDNASVIRKFTDVYKSAVSWTNKNPAKAGLLIEKHSFGLNSYVAGSSIPNAALVWRDAGSAKTDIEKFLTIVKSELPSGDFYINH